MRAYLFWSGLYHLRTTRTLARRNYWGYNVFTRVAEGFRDAIPWIWRYFSTPVGLEIPQGSRWEGLGKSTVASGEKVAENGRLFLPALPELRDADWASIEISGDPGTSQDNHCSGRKLRGAIVLLLFLVRTELMKAGWAQLWKFSKHFGVSTRHWVKGKQNVSVITNLVLTLSLSNEARAYTALMLSTVCTNPIFVYS
jgi:hypothetical protein